MTYYLSNCKRRLVITSVFLFISSFTFLFSQPGTISNHLNYVIVTFDSTGVARDVNNDLIFSIDTSTGYILDGSEAYIGRILGNQILDWDNNVLYTLNNENEILDINSDMVGRVDDAEFEIINISDFTLGTYDGIPSIYAVYFFYVFAVF